MREEKEKLKQEFEEYKEIIRNSSELSQTYIKEIYNKAKICYRKLQEIKILEEEEVNCIINKIIKEYNKDNSGYAESEFRSGGCYYFAIMLKKIFKDNAKIYICESSDIHAIIKVYDSFFDVRGNLTSNDINFEDYYEPTEDEFNYFIDLCYLYRNKENIEMFESKCNSIVDKIINEREEENLSDEGPKM